MTEENKQRFLSYEYKEVTVSSDTASFYLDCYESFGWKLDENFPAKESSGKTTLKLKRDRKLVNKTELTRLQRNFEANMDEISALERSKTSSANIWAFSIALVGTAFMAASVFAVTARPMQLVLSIILAVPGFAGWFAPYFVHQKVREKKTRQVAPYIEAKIEEIYEMCEKGQNLL